MSLTYQLRPGIQWIPGEKPGSHSYLLRGSSKNLLIDTGTIARFDHLILALSELGLGLDDINIVVLSHEHFDHIGAASLFTETAVIAAHRLAANKIQLQDEFVTLNRYYNAPARPFRADIWLEDRSVVDLDGFRLQVWHTPGHTSGCICLYEPDQRLLFSGDTVFARGTISNIAASGNISDYVNSLERLCSLRVDEMYPGHGRPSTNPAEDLRQALAYASTLFEESKVLFEALSQKVLRRN